MRKTRNTSREKFNAIWMGLKMEPMNMKEFVSLGILQELNREMLHPIGLHANLESNGHLSIVDGREDKEGLVYGLENIDRELTETFKEFKKKRHYDRIRGLKFIFEPYTPYSPQGLDIRGEFIRSI